LKAEVRPAGIIATGSYVPPKVLTNFDLEKMVDTSDEWIRTRTGIVERRIAEQDVATSDLAFLAAEAALADANLAVSDLDAIIVATVTPDTIFPCTAALLQQRFQTKLVAFDILVGCTGFVYGVALAGEMIAAHAYDHILVIGAETLSRITDWKDRSTCVLFGDAAGAAILGPVAEGHGILGYSLGNDGTNADALKIPAGGSRLPTSHQTIDKRLHYLASEEVVAAADLKMSDISLVIPHQANLRIIDAAARRFHLPYERFVHNLEKYGNTSAASIPLALDEARREGRIAPGDVILLSSFGAGLSWGSLVLRW